MLAPWVLPPLCMPHIFSLEYIGSTFFLLRSCPALVIPIRWMVQHTLGILLGRKVIVQGRKELDPLGSEYPKPSLERGQRELCKYRNKPKFRDRLKTIFYRQVQL